MREGKATSGQPVAVTHVPHMEPVLRLMLHADGAKNGKKKKNYRLTLTLLARNNQLLAFGRIRTYGVSSLQEMEVQHAETLRGGGG